MGPPIVKIYAYSIWAQQKLDLDEKASIKLYGPNIVYCKGLDSNENVKLEPMKSHQNSSSKYERQCLPMSAFVAQHALHKPSVIKRVVLIVQYI